MYQIAPPRGYMTSSVYIQPFTSYYTFLVDLLWRTVTFVAERKWRHLFSWRSFETFVPLAAVNGARKLLTFSNLIGMYGAELWVLGSRYIDILNK